LNTFVIYGDKILVFLLMSFNYVSIVHLLSVIYVARHIYIAAVVSVNKLSGRYF